MSKVRGSVTFRQFRQEANLVVEYVETHVALSHTVLEVECESGDIQ